MKQMRTEFEAAKKVVEEMRRRKQGLSTFGAGMLISLYQLGEDEAAEALWTDAPQKPPTTEPIGEPLWPT